MTNFKGIQRKWGIDLEKSKNLISLNNGEIDVWHWGDVESGKSNALLISKAPEMLEMLEDILNVIDWSTEHWQGNGGKEREQKIKQLIKEATEI